MHFFRFLYVLIETRKVSFSIEMISEPKDAIGSTASPNKSEKTTVTHDQRLHCAALSESTPIRGTGQALAQRWESLPFPVGAALCRDSVSMYRPDKSGLLHISLLMKIFISISPCLPFKTQIVHYRIVANKSICWSRMGFIKDIELLSRQHRHEALVESVIVRDALVVEPQVMGKERID